MTKFIYWRYAAIISLLLPGCSNESRKPVVTLDSYFNNEHRVGKSRTNESYHYKWEETDDAGFSIFGEILKQNNAIINTLYQPPTTNNLLKSNVYIIVDPDTPAENSNVQYIMAQDIAVIKNWVNGGGTLLLLGNDKNNTDLARLNNLSDVFGIHFNNDLILHVSNDGHFADGAIKTNATAPFKSEAEIFIKDACSITISPPARAILCKGKMVIIAKAKFGKGNAIAVGDPWVYNEYMNGRLPAEFDNKAAAADFVNWLLQL